MIKRLIAKRGVSLKTINGFFALFLMFLVSGCNSVQKSTDIYMYPDNIPPYIQTLEDILDTYGELENKGRFDEFLNNVQQGQEDSIRLVKYTTEGAPILYDYEFENDMIKLTIDTRRDGYGQRDIIHTTCNSIKVNEATKRTNYNLEGCDPSIEDSSILIIEK